MVFVYRIGTDWGDKKSICAKFPCTSPITTLIWPLSLSESIYFGALDGQVSSLLSQLATQCETLRYVICIVNKLG